MSDSLSSCRETTINTTSSIALNNDGWLIQFPIFVLQLNNCRRRRKRQSRPPARQIHSSRRNKRHFWNWSQPFPSTKMSDWEKTRVGRGFAALLYTRSPRLVSVKTVQCTVYLMTVTFTLQQVKKDLTTHVYAGQSFPSIRIILFPRGFNGSLALLPTAPKRSRNE